MPSLNLILAAVWLSLGVGVLAATYAGHDLRWYIRLGKTEVSVAWLAFALAGYNVVRWWLGRRRRATQRIEREVERRREFARQFRAAAPEEPPNPDFNFTEPPPPPA
jgi:hypothetical protein